MVAIRDPNEIVFTSRRGPQLTIRLQAVTPEISENFENVTGWVRLIADVGVSPDDHQWDPRKLDMFIGKPDQENYRSDSILGRLTKRLEEKFGAERIRVRTPTQSKQNEMGEKGQVMYWLQLEPVPDKTNIYHFTTAIRRTLNEIKEEHYPDQARRSRSA